MPEISVIVPVYNAEKYINRCVDSVLAQTFVDFELILVDDGSFDKCCAICDDYAHKDGRVRVFHKKNGGAASARNFGLSKATGAYVAFIDADDYIGKEYFEKLAGQLNNKPSYTIIQCGMTLETKDNKSLFSHKEMKCNHNEYIRMIISRQIPIFLFQSTVSKLYNRSILVDNNLLFDESVAISEDCLFNTQLMPFVNSYCYVDCNAYYYNQHNEDSLTHVKKRDFNSVLSHINVGIATSSMRNNCIIANRLQDDLEIRRGFQKAICIIYLSNINEIEESPLTSRQRKKLYEAYFIKMNYSIDLIIGEYPCTDKVLLNATKNKNHRIIHMVYKLRRLKRNLLNCLRK